MRLDGWQSRLKDVVQKHMRLPSQYGVSDCYLIPDDGVLALTGQRMYPDVMGYTNEIGAAKALREHGFTTVEDAFAAKFEAVHFSMAHRGDIGVVENNGRICGGIFISPLGFMTRDDSNVIFLRITEVKTAFKVGR